MMMFYLLVVVGVFACSAAQLLLKTSAAEKHSSPVMSFLNWRVLVAYSVMVISLLVNIYAMRRGVQLKDMPILEATGYLFVPCLSAICLKEHISRRTVLSIVFIVMGIIVFYL